MSSTPVIAARILAGDLPCVGREVLAALESGADRLHVDVMDLDDLDVTAGLYVCRTVKRLSWAPLEVHLLVKPAESVIAAFAEAGADAITFHPEASEDPLRTAAAVKQCGCAVGVALAPGTPLELLDPLLDVVDLVLVTCPAPGEHGTAFDHAALRFLRTLRQRLRSCARPVTLAVDGGVDEGNAAQLVAAGAGALVVQASPCGVRGRTPAVAAVKRCERASGGPPPARARRALAS